MSLKTNFVPVTFDTQLWRLQSENRVLFDIIVARIKDSRYKTSEESKEPEESEEWKHIVANTPDVPKGSKVSFDDWIQLALQKNLNLRWLTDICVNKAEKDEDSHLVRMIEGIVQPYQRLEITKNVIDSESNTFELGSSFKFEVVATGSPPPVYNWYFMPVDSTEWKLEIANAPTGLLQFVNFSSEDCGFYQCSIGHAINMVEANTNEVVPNVFSNAIEVNNAKGSIWIKKQPEPFLKVTVGRSVEISVEAMGSKVNYQWYHNDSMLKGSTSKVLKLDAVLPSNKGQYYCVISNSNRTARSNESYLEVNIHIY